MNGTCALLQGFPAALALQKLHCGFRMLGDAVVLVLMTPPPGACATLALLTPGLSEGSTISCDQGASYIVIRVPHIL